MKSLGDWLAKVEDLGELTKIEAEVDPVLEMSTITYLSGKQVGGPTLLFENIQGHPGFRVPFNPSVRVTPGWLLPFDKTLKRVR